MAILISAHALNSRFTQLVLSVLGLLGAIWFFTSTARNRGLLYVPGNGQHAPRSHPVEPPQPRPNRHPIENLITEADQTWNHWMKTETFNYKDAVKAYKKARGRHPPPNFDKWYEFAKAHGTVFVEDFWDQIYDDLTVFWGASPNQVRNFANSFENKIYVREQTVRTRTYDGELRDGMERWREMIEDIIIRDGWIPDVDLPVNIMDEPRILGRWEDINEHMLREKEGKAMVHQNELSNEYQRLAFLDKLHPGPQDPVWLDQHPYWNIITDGCHPMSAARHAYLDDHDNRHGPIYDVGVPEGSYYGFVRNWTLSKSICEYPNLQSLSGSFIEPISISTTHKLIPLFSAQKLSVNNDILMPGALAWSGTIYGRGEPNPAPWESKADKVFWRGQASGGRNREWNWTHFHRHRFVSMMNATSVRNASSGVEQPNFHLPDNNYYDLGVLKGYGATNDTLADWLQGFSDVGLTHLQCYPDENPPFCAHTDPYFDVLDADNGYDLQWGNKYLPDIDGNVGSARFRMYLSATSLPIKATMYHEWHDSRLIPWKHFVPMHNTYMDFYGIMDYFLGNPASGVEGHDAAAEKIALEGKAWTERVLRREDMMVYTYRLILEFARLCHDNRYKMGWTPGP